MISSRSRARQQALSACPVGQPILNLACRRLLGGAVAPAITALDGRKPTSSVRAQAPSERKRGSKLHDTVALLSHNSADIRSIQHPGSAEAKLKIATVERP